MAETYSRKDPLGYLQPKYDRAKEWFEGIAPDLREQWDMYMANDAYQRDREKLGFAHLSYPMIHVAIEAIQATVWKILQAEQNLNVFEPINQRDVFQKISAEHLTTAFTNIRSDLDYDSKVMEMVQGSSIFSYTHMKLETEKVLVEPGLGLLVEDGDEGMMKTYPSWNMYAPGRVIYDGSFESDKKITARFQESFVSYNELQQDWPDQVGLWLMNHERPLNEVEYSSRNSMSSMHDETIYYFYKKALGRSGGNDQRRGFLLVQAFFEAVNDQGKLENRVVWWLPQVVPNKSNVGVHRNGYVLADQKPAFASVPQPFRTCRSRRLPFSVIGRGTSELMISLQRQFSAQIAQEMDMDQLHGSPPILMREGVWIGREDPSFSSREIWTVTDPEGAQKPLPLDQLVAPMPISSPNRQHLLVMDQKLERMGEMVSAAMEGQTGANTSDTNKTLGAFQGRQEGAFSRIMIQFVEHASNLIWLNKQTVRMMREAPQEFLYPPIQTFSESLGAEGILTMQHLAGAHRSRVPAFSEHVGKESTKVLWRMVGDGLAMTPIYAESPELQLWWVERMVRSMGVPEADVQEAMIAAKQGVFAANKAIAETGLVPAVNGGAPRVNPGQSGRSGQLRPQLAA